MDFETVEIMEIPFLNITKQNLMRHIITPNLQHQQSCFIVTANPEFVMKTRDDPSYKNILQSADAVIPDGTGILVAAKMAGKPLQERIPGYDLVLDLLGYAQQADLSVYFLGAKEYVNHKAVTKVQEKFPDLKIAGQKNGYLNLDDDNEAYDIVESEPDIVLVALGMPKQEKWIAAHRDKFNKGLFIGVGGSFDVLAGEVKRAPQKWIDLNLEWLYRIFQQPSRIKRIMKVFEFMGRMLFRRKGN